MNCRHSHGMWYSVLGPLEVLRDGCALDLGPRQRRLLLTRLLVEYGRPVSPAELCPTLWPEDTPTAAVLSVLSVRVHISRLRADLEPDRQGKSSVLVSGAYGYALKISPQARDTYAFEQSVDRARGALGQQDLALTRQEIDAALELWRGEALGEATEHTFALREASRLNAARQDARELQTTIRLQQGDMERAVHVALHLTVTAPLREVSWALLMRAPYGAGRPGEALRHYERFRGMLSRELGLDPSHGLRKLHTSVLCHDTAVLGAPRPSRSVSTLTTPPRAISPLTTPLVGRGKEVAQLHALLGAAAPGHVQWAVVSGDPGSGKTRLLDEAAAQATRTGFDVIWAGGGRGPDTDRTAALHGRDTRPTDEPRPHGGVDGAPDGTGTYPVTTLVREVTRAPVLCVIDDVDRADPAVAERLGRLTTLLHDEPVVFLCALPQPAVTTVSGLLAEPARLGTSWLYLEPLTVADVRQLLAERGEKVHDAEAQQGNPFTLGELLKLPAAQRCGPLGTHGCTAPGSCCTPRSRVSSSTGAAPTRHGSPAISERPARWARSRNPFRVSDAMK
ncbi:BTAD domain-containing putative transcriptional regulator [Streptomyces coelicoflavus]|uniref:BTAD domain-containing putative transcriptional regulator n=1 Tax=Streptomyces coelicoflavus TaxID=285562 RepID=UPI0024ACFC18|nr:BTAD domain-containing putative transcriptional regulator [Streptomyces coelicoflavus]MDI6520389.1 BTAD domain-containing putative transcriptional regulator [Streptomyces coelicoflavus]